MYTIIINMYIFLNITYTFKKIYTEKINNNNKLIIEVNIFKRIAVLY